MQAVQAGISVESAQAQIETEGPSEEPHAQPVQGEGGHRRKRRRRRRRGHGPGMEGATPSAPTAMPDRHIFRVGADGSAEPTGQTAPREPVRAIAPWNRKAQPPAVEPPPPHLRAPEEHAKPTKPARRRRTAGAQAPAGMGGELAGSRTAALPAPEPEKPKRTRRTKAATASETPAVAAEKPKRTRTKASEGGAAGEAPVKRTTRTRKSADQQTAAEPAVKKTRVTRKSSATKTTTRKKKTQ